MPPWMLKAAVQGVVAHMPNANAINNRLQHITGNATLDITSFEHKLRQCALHIDAYRTTVGDLDARPRVALEVGTGWHPIVPVGLGLCGVGDVRSYDIAPLASEKRIVETLSWYSAYSDSGRLVELLPAVQENRLEWLEGIVTKARSRGARTVLAEYGVRCLIDDASATGLPEGSIELLVSNNVLGHIPLVAIERILTEFRRLAAPGAVMSHFVEMTDQYAGFDSSITVFNMLKYSGARWKLFNNALQFQNRLRVSDHRHIHAQSGFEIVVERCSEGSDEELAAVRLAPEFERYARDDLRVVGAWLTSIPA